MLAKSIDNITIQSCGVLQPGNVSPTASRAKQTQPKHSWTSDMPQKATTIDELLTTSTVCTYSYGLVVKSIYGTHIRLLLANLVTLLYEEYFDVFSNTGPLLRSRKMWWGSHIHSPLHMDAFCIQMYKSPVVYPCISK